MNRYIFDFMDREQDKFYGATGSDAASARRGVHEDRSSLRDHLAYAFALLAKGEPGSQPVALRALSRAMLSEDRRRKKSTRRP